MKKILHNNKIYIVLIFIIFSIFWFWNFTYAFFYMIGIPVVFYFYEKNNGDKYVFKNHSYLVFVSIVVFIAYVGLMVQYLSIQNPNKLFNENKFEINSYSISEYKSIRTRSDGQLLVKNNETREVINCSIISYGKCPYYKEYNKDIDIGFIKLRKTAYHFFSRKDKPNFAYYIKFDNEVLVNEYFIKKYDSEIKKIYIFLISLNLYIFFLFYIKKIYSISLKISFVYVFSRAKEALYCIFLLLISFLLPIISIIS